MFVLSAIVAFGLPWQAMALGQMTKLIEVKNAIRGEEYQSEMLIYNSEKKEIGVSLTAEGETGQWVKFYQPTDLQNPISEAIVPADGNIRILAKFFIPTDQPNGSYKGLLNVTQKNSVNGVQDESVNAMKQMISRKVAIDITGLEDIKLSISVIPNSYDIKAGDPLNIRLIYDNQGNVSLQPKIELKIKNGDNEVLSADYPYPTSETKVIPLSQHEIPALNISTNNLPIGRYHADLKFYQGDNKIATKTFYFNVIENKGLVAGLKINGADFLPWLIGLGVVALGLFFFFFLKMLKSRSAKV